MPELPEARTARFSGSYGLSDYDCDALTSTRALGDYFEAVVAAGAPPKTAASWIETELLRRLERFRPRDRSEFRLARGPRRADPPG